LLQLGLRAQQHPDRLNQVLAGPKLASGPGGQRTEIREEPVGTRCQRALALVGLDMDAGREQHRDVRRRRVAFQDFANPEPIDPPEQQVEDDGVGQLLAGAVERFEAILGGEHAEAFALQPLDERLEALGIVVGDQDSPGAALLAHATLGSGPRATG